MPLMAFGPITERVRAEACAFKEEEARRRPPRPAPTPARPPPRSPPQAAARLATAAAAMATAAATHPPTFTSAEALAAVERRRLAVAIITALPPSWQAHIATAGLTPSTPLVARLDIGRGVLA